VKKRKEREEGNPKKPKKPCYGKDVADVEEQDDEGKKKRHAHVTDVEEKDDEYVL
jgi:hypothetical protein